MVTGATVSTHTHTIEVAATAHMANCRAIGRARRQNKVATMISHINAVVASAVT